ncbi:hypothetical protein GCM10027169_12030 [Gordonia jinhuaensis]|uniref:Heavy-metal-associated domain-containing protein n=1 Tax=Gordonia jinhuaensis TaxID=1517702 RepID=A0A916WUT0_9ACTN|nr:hypothetical protein [Gordonia jinhuaensis]GGB31761.1 hypothetical protein GCM10011489_19960 [Gordonia jinhuaensis]
MKTPARLGLYGAGLAVAFGGAFGLAGVVVPASAVDAWAKGTGMSTHSQGHTNEQQTAGQALNGVSLSADGFALSPVKAPTATGTEGELSFQVIGQGGPVTEFEREHDKDLHLIVVRSDGAQFRHVHPMLNEATGTWSLPWTWQEAGTYRVYTDFTPPGEGASGITLTRTVQVAGDYAPVASSPKRIDEVDGYTVTLDGGLAAGSTSELTLSVSRDGEPVTTLEPYLGAYGHLVALREGDLAYLHVHPEGKEPEPGSIGGADIAFAAQAPTAGRYLLYLDFQVDGKVHTAEFVVDAGHAGGTQADDDSHSGGH